MTPAQLHYAETHWREYPARFFKWLEDNEHIWIAFEKQALRMASIRSHYSARTIIEVLRWNSDISEGSNELFKINDHCIPGLSRLWMSKHGKKHPKFFEHRRLK